MTTRARVVAVLVTGGLPPAARLAAQSPPVATGGLSAPAGSPKQLVVYPPRVKLSGPRDEQRLIVLGVWADGRRWDLTRTASYASGSPRTATAAPAGMVRPAGDGTTTG